MKITFPIVGMHCASCAKLIEKKLKKTPGVVDAAVNYGSEQASVECDPTTATSAVLSQAVSDIGYKAIMENEKSPDGKTAEQQKEIAKKKELKTLNRKVIASGILTVLILIGSLNHMLGTFAVRFPLFSPILKCHQSYFLLLTIPVLFWAGSEFL